MNFNKYKEELLFLPLGGANEIGMNLNMYHYNGKWLVVDCGIGFADDYLPGADLIVPDIGFLVEQKDNILGMVMTHAHEDHVGAIPYIWEYVKAPIYTTKFTSEFLKAKLTETKFAKQVKIHEITSKKPFKLGDFEIEAINITHSIPEMQGLAINTPKGKVLHTGDWKIDPKPVEGEATDFETLKRVGKQGVLAMVCDSTNVFSHGHSISEDEVKNNLIEAITEIKQRAVVTTFASNISRIRTILEAAKITKRKVVVAGRSLWRIIQVAKDSGYLQDTPELINDKQFQGIARKDVLLICTGCQGEPRAAMSRIAEKTHPKIKLLPDDTIIFSSKIIPGNEKSIFRMLNLLSLQGMNVITEKDKKIHTSGHPYRDELAQRYDGVKPQIAIPVHGEARHIKEHAEFAKTLGVPDQVKIQNGEVLQLQEGEKPRKVGKVECGIFALDCRKHFAAPDGEVMTCRRKQRRSGSVFVSAVINKKGDIVTDPVVITPGLFDSKSDKEIVEKIFNDVAFAIEGKRNPDDATKAVKKLIKKFCKHKFDKNPVIEIHIHQVA